MCSASFCSALELSSIKSRERGWPQKQKQLRSVEQNLNTRTINSLNQCEVQRTCIKRFVAYVVRSKSAALVSGSVRLVLISFYAEGSQCDPLVRRPSLRTKRGIADGFSFLDSESGHTELVALQVFRGHTRTINLLDTSSNTSRCHKVQQLALIEGKLLA